VSKSKPKPMLRWYKGPRPSATISPENDGRPVLQTAWLRPKDEPGEWSLQTTNSFVFALLPVRVDADERLRERAAAHSCGAVPLPPKALLELERSRTAETFAIFEDDGSVTVGDTTFHPPDCWPSGKTEEGFPELVGSFPDPEALRREPKERFEMGFSASLLRDAAAAMGQAKVRLIIDTSSPNVMFFFEALEGYGSAEAIIMPVRINA
jgi:hypothetical protein